MAIRIELDDPELGENLVRFLVDAGYVVRRQGGGAVEAQLPFADDELAAVDLRMLLRAWSAETSCGSMRVVAARAV